MNVLNDEDAKEIHRVLCATVGADYLTIAKAASDFTIKKLAAGVSVEPSAYRFTENRGNGNTEFNYYGLDEVGMAYRDNCLEITPLYTATAIAAARVQENERCLALMDAIGCDWRDAGDMAKFYATNYLREAIRALLGKESKTSL